jgi:hypothetical protein
VIQCTRWVNRVSAVWSQGHLAMLETHFDENTVATTAQLAKAELQADEVTARYQV